MKICVAPTSSFCMKFLFTLLQGTGVVPCKDNPLYFLQLCSEWDFISFTYPLPKFHMLGKKPSRRKVIQLQQEDPLIMNATELLFFSALEQHRI